MLTSHNFVLAFKKKSEIFCYFKEITQLALVCELLSLILVKCEIWAAKSKAVLHIGIQGGPLVHTAGCLAFGAVSGKRARFTFEWLIRRRPSWAQRIFKKKREGGQLP